MSINDICIGIDGNIYLRSTKNIFVIYNSESDNPKVKLLYDNIPDLYIQFPNYLYPCDVFACQIGCNKKANFSYNNNNDDIISYHWNFGDGEISTSANPEHIYKNVGTYNVSLEVTLKNGYKKFIPSRKILIADKKVSAEFNNSIICSKDETLTIKLSGTEPFEIIYTINDKEKKKS